MFPGIATALHEIRTTASDEERAWAEDRARHPEHIHVDYRDRWWPAEETGLKAMQAARRKLKSWRLSNPKARPLDKKRTIEAAEEEAEHAERMHALQRSCKGTLRRNPCNWMPKGALHLLTDTEMLEIKPTIMDWAMRRVLRDKEDAEIKEMNKQQEREKKEYRTEETEEEREVGEPSRPAKRARMDTRTRDDDEDVSDSNDISDDADPNGRQEKTQEHKKARAGPQLEEDIMVDNTTIKLDPEHKTE